ncbi:MAG TPA: PA14 domain-containing protein [Candidatus Saccharimonadales bacterium]|nr:PA14 domain-containing protein [Candidatus Saccharimonadales bacterium]
MQAISKRKIRKISLFIFVLSYFIFSALQPTLVSAEGNPFVPTTDNMQTGLTAQVGGEELDVAAQDIANFTDITGAYYDSSLNRIVFIGTTNGTGPKYNKDDVALAIKSIYYNNTMPDVSIDDNPNNPSSSSAIVNYSGPIQNTNLGSELFNADYKYKQYVIGYDPNNVKVTSSVPTYKSVVDRYVALNPNPVLGNQTKFILSPQAITIKNSTANNAFVFSNVAMQATAQAINPNNDPQWNQAASDFVSDMTTNYNQYAQESVDLTHAQQVAKIVAILKWVSDNNIPTDFHAAQYYTPDTVSSPSTVQKVTTPVFPNGYSAQGEVKYSTPNTYVPDDGTAANIKNASQAVSTSKEDVTWTFTNGAQQYQAVAITADAFKSLGGYSGTVTDLSTPLAGDLSLKFQRSYSSFSNAQTGIGLGWDFMSARLADNNFPQSINITTCNNVLYITQLALDTQNGHETFTFNCSNNGYVADDPSFHTKLVQNSDGSLTATESDQTKLNFNADFQLTSMVDKNANKINYSYDGSGKLTSMDDTKGHTFTVAYNGQNLISSVTDWTNRKVQYSYNGNGNLTGVTDPNNNTTNYGYDSNSRLATITDRTGQVVLTNTYGSDARIATQTSAAGLIKTNTYDNVNKKITQTDNNGRSVVTTYDSKARILQQTDPAGKSNTYTYGNEAVPLTQKDKNNNVTTFTYDSSGNVNSVTFPDTSVINYTFDSNNRVTKILDGRYGTPAKETDNTYDASGNLTQRTEAGLTTTFTFDSAGEPLTMTDPLNHTITWTRNSLGNILTQKDANNNVINFTYDSLGRLTKQTDPNNSSVSYTYDANGNMLTSTEGAGTTTYTYDKEDRLKTTTDPDNSVNQYAYNTSGSLSSVTDALNNTTTYGYDTYQSISSQQNALNNTTTNSYDNLNRQTQATTPLGKATKWTYDANGNIASKIDANNKTTSYTYDSLNRLTKITYPDLSTVTFTLDNRGNITKMVDSVGTATYTYDNFDRLTQAVDEYGHTITYTYDNAGNMKTLTYPDGKIVTYNYDPTNKMTSVLDWNNHTTSYTYNKNGTVAARTLPNGVSSNYDYDISKRLIGVTHKSSTATLAQFNYVRDNAGKITNAVEQGSFISPPNGNTWYAQYYDNQTLSGTPKLTRLDNTLSFNWGTGSPDSSIPSDHFSARWTRAISFTAGSYKFTSTSDDGARIYVDGELVYDNWNGSGLTTVNTTKDINAGTHIVEYEYQENTGSAQASLSITQVTNPYAAQYYNNQTLTGTPTLTRNDNAINFNWGTGSPGTGIPNDHFSARWTRTDNFANGNYTFTTTTNDGVRLYVDNSLVIDKWTDVTATSAATYTTSQNLTAGNHTIKMEYYEATGSATAVLNYQPTSYTAQYYNNQTLSGSPTLTRQENAVNYNWGAGSPDLSIPSDHFSARWTKTQNFAAGVYQFTTATDDGVRLYIDNNLVTDKWVDGTTNYSIFKYLSSGTHTIQMEYYENTGNASAQLSIQQIAPQNITTFTYDADGRVTNVLYPNNNSYAYTYDKVGNKLTDAVVNDPVNGTFNNTYQYDQDSKLTNINGYTSFTYDNNGNMTEKPSQSPNPDTFYTYNAENKMTQFYNANTNNQYNYTYDGFGNRLRTDFSTTITRYVTDMSADMPRTLATYIGPNGNGVVGTEYLYGLGVISENGSSYYLEDGLGSTRFITNSTGGNAGSTSYDPYGNMRSFTSAGTFLFQQQQLDGEDDMYYMRARYYDPTIGRFISKDPYAGDLPNPMTQNPYTYGLDNPIQNSDPSGRSVDGQVIPQIVKNQQQGSIFEQFVLYQLNQPKNTALLSKLIPGSGYNRIPDMINVYARQIGEIKSGAYVRNSSQLEAFIDIARRYGYKFTLYIKPGATVAPALSREILKVGGRIVVVGASYVTFYEAPMLFILNGNVNTTGTTTKG